MKDSFLLKKASGDISCYVIVVTIQIGTKTDTIYHKKHGMKCNQEKGQEHSRIR